MKQDISQTAKKLGKRGGAITKRRGSDYYRQIGKLGLAKRYSFKGLTPLMVPVPPMLEQAIGYEGDARFVSFYWTPGGDEADYDDGQSGGNRHWPGAFVFIHH